MSDSKQDQSYLKRYDTVIGFLALELIALTLFGLGGATGLSILQIVSVFVAFLIYPYIRNNFQGNFKKEALITLIPLAVLMALLAFGPFWSKAYYGGNALSIILYGGLTLLGGLGFFIVGYGTGHMTTLKVKYLFAAIIIGLAAYVLLSGAYSLFRYGPFYVARYSGMVYYYEGVVFPIARETKALIGFQFVEVTLSYGKAASTILACSGVGLFAISPKKDMKVFIIVAVGAALGLLDLIFTPYKRGLLIVFVVAVLSCIFYFLHYLSKRNEHHKKVIQTVLKWTFIVLIALVVLGVLALVIDAKTGFIRKMNIPKISANLASDSGYLGSARLAIEAVMNNGNTGGSQGFSIVSFLFGCVPYNVIKCNFFEFDVLWQTGFLGFAALLFIIFHGIKKGKEFLESERLPYGYSLSIVAILLAGFIYYSITVDEAPYIYSNVFLPLSRTAMPFAGLFLLGMMHAHPSKEVAQ